MASRKVTPATPPQEQAPALSPERARTPWMLIADLALAQLNKLGLLRITPSVVSDEIHVSDVIKKKRMNGHWNWFTGHLLDHFFIYNQNGVN
ncbi:hypothetical protein DFQ27_006543 [Actinomortierella ambigua]|uniref:Uncharacterized protein n=1 Tax=Actinomortierella ambigua TaxID=1343610 RepID=A0A9P6PVJ9_9FUNG|nr:hypothetical protein DFQ27_006543 [Actinomortierella ambigua]